MENSKSKLQNQDNPKFSNYAYKVFQAQKNLSNPDITGYHTRIIQTKADAAYPAWSPTIGANVK